MALWPPRSCDLRPSREEELPEPSAQIYNDGIELACQQQKEFVKSSVECKWNLAEAQQKLGSLALHNSESLDQEHAKAQTEAAELRWREEEWRRKEEALRERERQDLRNAEFVSKEVFNKVQKLMKSNSGMPHPQELNKKQLTRECKRKLLIKGRPALHILYIALKLSSVDWQSFINQMKRKEVEDDASKSFMQRHEQKIRHFGMLSRWFDSQRFLSDHPYLVCEETARYLLLWCFHLEAEQKGALMEQVAHQAVVMQFIIEMAKSCNVDPRGCFRLFFQKAKAGEEGYLEAFKNELEAFKSRVRICSQSQNFHAMSVQNPFVHTDMNCIGGFASFPQDADSLQGCSLNSKVHRDEEEPKMMDTV